MRPATKIKELKIPELNGIKIEREVRAGSQKTRIYLMGWSKIFPQKYIGIQAAPIDSVRPQATNDKSDCWNAYIPKRQKVKIPTA